MRTVCAAACGASSLSVKNKTLQPKHDIIAELFFLFNKSKVTIDSVIFDLLDVMDENEIELFLTNIINKKEIRKGRKPPIGKIDYRGYLECIHSRIQKGSLNLSHTGSAYLCLGFLWTRYQKNLSESCFTIKTVLDNLAPEIENDLLVAKLYTEWGIWLAEKKEDSSAEKKFLAVIEYNPKQLPARTELGRLLSRQKGREEEAEKFLLEAIKIDPKNLHPRTVLAKLYEIMDRLPEAKQLYQELCNIDPGNRFGTDGLSRLK